MSEQKRWIANHWGGIPVVLLLIPFMAGIILGLQFGYFGYHTVFYYLLIVFSAAFVFLNIFYKRFNVYKKSWMGGLMISVIFILSGWISVCSYIELNRNSHFSKYAAHYLVVQVNTEPILKNGYLRFAATVDENIDKGKKTATSGTLLINLKDSTVKAQHLYYGDELLIPANHSSIDPSFNPAEFNYKQYLADKNIYFQSFLYQGQFIVLQHDAGNPLIAYALKLRQHLVEKLKLNMHDPNAIAVASALLLGYRAELGNDVLQAYSDSGTIYVLTVSGAQLAVIYFLLNFIFGFLNRYKYGKLLKAAIIISAVWYYTILTGLSPAICRAALVLSLVVTGKAYSRYVNSLNMLAISAFVLLLYDPFLITEVGFQLAYLAVSGLIIFRPVIYKWLKFNNKWANKAWNIASVSIAAQLVTFPLSAYYFHQFPVYFLAGNLLAAIPVTIIMYTGIIYLLLPHIAILSRSLGYILEHTILFMNKMLAMIQHAPISAINKIWITNFDYLLLYAIIISLFLSLYKRKASILISTLVCLLALSISISYKKINNLSTGNIAFLNMRKHTGIILRNGTNAIVISDLADTDRNYRYSIQPYLDSSGVNQTLVCTADKNVTSAFAKKTKGFVQFNDKRILLCDGKTSNEPLNECVKADYLYLSANPYRLLKSLSKKHVAETLVIDGSNSDNFIKLVKKQADTLGIKYYLLKRNISMIVVSN